MWFFFPETLDFGKQSCFSQYTSSKVSDSKRSACVLLLWASVAQPMRYLCFLIASERPSLSVECGVVTAETLDPVSEVLTCSRVSRESLVGGCASCQSGKWARVFLQ